MSIPVESRITRADVRSLGIGTIGILATIVGIQSTLIDVWKKIKRIVPMTVIITIKKGREG